MHLNRSWPAVSHLQQKPRWATVFFFARGALCSMPVGHWTRHESMRHSQLQAEGNTQHFEPLHLKVHTDCCLVVLIKCVFAKPKRRKGKKVRGSRMYVNFFCAASWFPRARLLIRQVFPTARSPTTITLEILNLLSAKKRQHVNEWPNKLQLFSSCGSTRSPHCSGSLLLAG